MWYSPKPDSDDHKGIILGNYIIPSAVLAVSPRPNGNYYDVKFKVIMASMHKTILVELDRIVTLKFIVACS